MFLKPLSKCSCRFFNVFFIASQPVMLVLVDHPPFLDDTITVLWGHHWSLMVLYPLKCICTLGILQMLLKLSLMPLVYSSTMCVVLLSVSTVLFLMLLLLLEASCACYFLSWLCSMTSWGNLHFCNAFLRCFPSFCSLGLEQCLLYLCVDYTVFCSNVVAVVLL